jgi:hypothetical protein
VRLVSGIEHHLAVGQDGLAFAEMNRGRGEPQPGIQSSMVSLTRCVIVAGGSSRANVTVLSKPSGPVINTRTPPRNGSAAIQPSYG